MKNEANPMDVFREEAQEILAEFEQTLINLEQSPGDVDLVDSAFRNLHTLKGAAAMFGFSSLVEVTHLLEAVFEQVRSSKSPISQEIIDTALQSQDEISRLVQAALDGDASQKPDPAILSAIQHLAGDEVSAHLASQAGTPATSAQEKPIKRTFRIEYVPHPDVFKNGGNPIALLKDLKELGNTLIIGFCRNIPSICEIDPEECFLGWEILLTTEQPEEKIQDIFLFAQDSRRLEIIQIDGEDFADSEVAYKRLGELLVERGDLQPDQLESVMGHHDQLGKVLLEKGYITGEQLESALEEQRYVRHMRESRQKVELSSTIKVKTEKLNSLVNLVGELGTLQARLGMMCNERQDEELFSVSEQLESMLRQLRELAMDMHMVPVGLLFTSFRRMVRDLATELGKDVAFIQEGAEAELDKNVQDRLKDPLLHIIRNSIDHGLETPERRRELGKPAQGKVIIRAQYSGASVVIEVEDDGAGLDVEKIRAKAEERQLITPGQDLSEQEIYNLIFEPGFSTTEVATNVSGRGVGMDVVRSNLESISGSVNISSVPGKGSIMSLRIPLTLAILEGLLAPVAGQRFLVNLVNVIECVDLEEYDCDHDEGLVTYRGSKLPMLNIARMFGFTDEIKARYLLIVSNGQKKIGLAIDDVPSSYQGVVKPLGRMFARNEGFSGAVMLGDGTPALVLDVERLFR